MAHIRRSKEKEESEALVEYFRDWKEGTWGWRIWIWEEFTMDIWFCDFMFCSRQLACQYGNHYKVVNSNPFLDTTRDWEVIQEFRGRLYMNHTLLYRKGSGPLLYHQVIMRMCSMISLLKISHGLESRPHLINSLRLACRASFKHRSYSQEDSDVTLRLLIRHQISVSVRLIGFYNLIFSFFFFFLSSCLGFWLFRVLFCLGMPILRCLNAVDTSCLPRCCGDSLSPRCLVPLLSLCFILLARHPGPL